MEKILPLLIFYYLKNLILELTEDDSKEIYIEGCKPGNNLLNSKNPYQNLKFQFNIYR